MNDEKHDTNDASQAPTALSGDQQRIDPGGDGDEQAPPLASNNLGGDWFDDFQAALRRFLFIQFFLLLMAPLGVLEIILGIFDIPPCILRIVLAIVAIVCGGIILFYTFQETRRNEYPRWDRALTALLIVVAIAGLAVFAFQVCVPNNRCPSKVTLKISPERIHPGETAHLQVEAKDRDNDQLDYCWSAGRDGLLLTGGPYEEPGNEYTAPLDSAGNTVEIVVRVNDRACGKEIKTSGEVVILRSPPTGTPTSTLSPTPTHTPSQTPTYTPSATPTYTPTPEPTSTPSLTPTYTPSTTPTSTPSPTPTSKPAPPRKTPTKPAPAPQPTYPAPTLLEPSPEQTLYVPTLFKWQWDDDPLDGNFAFDLRIWSEHEDRPDEGAVDKPGKETEILVDLEFVPAITKHGNGVYYWTVVVVENSARSSRVVGPTAEPRWFKYDGPIGQSPPPNTPTPTPITPTPNQSPVARFTYSCSGLKCDFDGGASSDPDGSIVSHSWDFGGGEGGSGKTISHKFKNANTYQVVLTVTDNEDATDTESKNVKVP